MESVISASMMVLSIRTHKSIRHSKPSRALLSATLAIAIVTLLLPYTPLAGLLGFQALPLEFPLVLAALVGLYIFCAETMKRVFYSRVKFSLFLVASRNPTILFQPIEATLHPVALTVERLVKHLPLCRSLSLRGTVILSSDLQIQTPHQLGFAPSFDNSSLAIPS